MQKTEKLILWMACLFLSFSGSIHAEKPTIINQNSREVFHRLQEAIDAASPEDVLKIKGTCVGNFVILKSLTLVGGHDATLDGNKSGSTLTIMTPGLIAITQGNVDESVSVIIDNLTIQNGFAGDLGGGGLLNIGANVVIRNASIINNFALIDAGGGISNMTLDVPGSIFIDDSEIKDNTALFGGGIANTGGFLEIINSKINANLAERAGGGLFSFFGINSILESQISFNAAVLQGGGIENIADSQTLLSDVEMIDNHAAQGGGIFSGSAFFGGSSVAINNCKLHGNNVQTFGGGIYNDSNSTVAVNFSKITRNGAGDGGGIFQNAGGTTLITDSEIKKNIPNNIVGLVAFVD